MLDSSKYRPLLRVRGLHFGSSFNTHLERSLFLSHVEVSSLDGGSFSVSTESFEKSERLALLFRRLVIERSARVFARCARAVVLRRISKTITFHAISIRSIRKNITVAFSRLVCIV